MPNDIITLPPFAPMLVGALLLGLFPKSIRSGFFLLFPALALMLVWTLPDETLIRHSFLGFDLILCEVNKLSRLFGTIFALIAIIGGVYSLHQKAWNQQCAALVYAGGALGLTFAGDFLSLFVFWELMAVSSTVLIWASRNPESDRAGMRYLMVHLFGGGLLMLGILLYIHQTGDSSIRMITPDGTLAPWLILAGVALNTAIPPLHAWLADAYPKATVTGAVFLSAFTTKSAVLILMRLFPGWEILTWLGVTMALYGVVYAVLANDIRAILAYHIISQVGYMVAAVGIGTEMALNGAAAHAFSHILYKALLFMGAGVVLHATGKSKLTELGGLSRAMPITLGLYMIGAFSISGFPLFNGFISKSMVLAAAGKAHLDSVMLLLLLASVGTFLHTGLKLPYFTWWNGNQGPPLINRIPRNMLVGMAIAAAFCTLFGIAPGILYQHLPHPVSYKPYTLYHLTETVQILTFTFAAFWLLRKKLAGENLLPLDTDWVYRRPAAFWRLVAVDLPSRVFSFADNQLRAFAGFLGNLTRNPSRWQPLLRYPSEAPGKGRLQLQTEITLVLGCVLVLAILIFS